MSFFRPAFFALATLLLTLPAWAENTPRAKIGQAAPDFELTDTHGKKHKLSTLQGKFVILEWLNHECPFVVRLHGMNPVASWEQRPQKRDNCTQATCLRSQGGLLASTPDTWVGSLGGRRQSKGWTTRKEGGNIPPTWPWVCFDQRLEAPTTSRWPTNPHAWEAHR